MKRWCERIVLGLGLGLALTSFPWRLAAGDGVVGAGLRLPDLVIDGPSSRPRLVTETFLPGDCEVNECATLGTRRLLRFATYVRNQGMGDLVIGSPAGNPLFRWDPCHGHYHFDAIAEFRLLTLDGRSAGLGHKVGYCLSDNERFDPGSSPATVFTCDYQGIQPGWVDVYGAHQPCQFIDVTGVPPGSYLLEQEIDPGRVVPESDDGNNVVRIPVEITAACVAAPANDGFGSAQPILYRTATVRGGNECATRENGEPVHAGQAGGHSLWFRWTAAESGPVTVGTDGSDFDTVLAVYLGDELASLTLVAEDDDRGEGLTSSVTFTAVAGTVYRMAVDGFGDHVGGVVLTVNPEGNDRFADALGLAGVSGRVGGRTALATRELDEPRHAGSLGGHSLWYRWVAPESGWMIFETASANFDTVLGVYRGDDLATLDPVAADDDAGVALGSRVQFAAVAGEAYFVAVDGKGDGFGEFDLCWRRAAVLEGVGRAEGGSFVFELGGGVGERYVVETSPDLVRWVEWRRDTNTAGRVRWVFPGLGGSEWRFFRVRTE